MTGFGRQAVVVDLGKIIDIGNRSRSNVDWGDKETGRDRCC